MVNQSTDFRWTDKRDFAARVSSQETVVIRQVALHHACYECSRRCQRRRDSTTPYMQQIALRKLFMLDKAQSLNDLRIPPANRLEALKADRKGQHSIRINDQWRICFVWTRTGPQAVEIVDYH